MSYPPEWKTGAIQRQIRELANHCCENCGMAFVEGTNLAVSEVRSNGFPIVGTVHHLDGNPANCGYENLVYVCQRCHLHIQAVWFPGDPLHSSWLEVPGWIVKRGLPYQVVQPRLF